MTLDRLALREIVARALREDLGSGDVTTEALVDPKQNGRAVIATQEPCVLAGLPVAELVFKVLDESIFFEPQTRDGECLAKGQTIVEIQGSLAAILKGERTALNFLQRLSSIATATGRYVEAVKDLSVEILDTRKTVPGLRLLDKYAVHVGGGRNHRTGLYDGILIKDNHIRAVGGIATAIEQARRRAPTTLKIEIEVSNLQELQEALQSGADIIMLDNMSLEEMRQAVKIAREDLTPGPSPHRRGVPQAGRGPLLEASGGVTLENVRAIAETGVNFISVGALTHAVKAIDMHLEVLAV